MQIIEIYKSLQGESSYAGLPCVFVRTAGCNLRCVWCDSEYTFKGGQRMTLDEIVHEVHRLSPDGGLVEITGGEPMLQEGEVLSLMDRLLITGFTVLLETSGERLLDKVPALGGEDRRREVSTLGRGRNVSPRQSALLDRAG